MLTYYGGRRSYTVLGGLVTLWSLFFFFGTNAQQPFTSINYGNGIPCNAPITLNIGGRAFPRLVPFNNTCFLQMTTDDAIARGTTAFLPFRFNVANVYDFTVRFKYRMFGPSQGIGDGLAFVLHDDPRGTFALGGEGGQLGIYGPNLITPAIVFEFDSVRNSEIGDNRAPAIHVRAITGTNFTEISQVPAPVRSTSMDNLKEAIISYQNGRLTVELDGNARIALATNFSNVLRGRDLIVGFAAATGDQADLHDILEWTMQQGAPTGMPSSMPSRRPSTRPSRLPSRRPDVRSNSPSRRPSARPSKKPSRRPSTAPSRRPTTRMERHFFERILDVIRIIIGSLRRIGGGGL